MDTETFSALEEALAAAFVGYQTDSFNRAINALEEASAVDTTEMRRAYKGIGRKYYDLVTKSFEYTATCARPLLKKLLIEKLISE